MILDLLAGGKRVGVTANSHKVISNLLAAVWAGEMNLAFERAGVDDRATAESHATQLARARAAGDTAAEAHLLLNPPSTHIGPPAKHSWEDRPGRAQALKLDGETDAPGSSPSAGGPSTIAPRPQPFEAAHLVARPRRVRTVIECAVKGATPQRVRIPPGNCRSSR